MAVVALSNDGFGKGILPAWRKRDDGQQIVRAEILRANLSGEADTDILDDLAR